LRKKLFFSRTKDQAEFIFLFFLSLSLLVTIGDS